MRRVWIRKKNKGNKRNKRKISDLPGVTSFSGSWKMINIIFFGAIALILMMKISKNQ